MKRLSMQEICRVVNGRWLSQARPASVDCICTDTRDAASGSLFIALRGDRFDGHVFLPQAADAGCVAAMVRRDSEPPPQVAERFPGGVIGVADTTRALGGLAAHHRSITNAAVVAVTGSNGKTTVKQMIHRILSTRFKGTCSPKSFNNAIGVPLTLLGVCGADDYVVCEIGSSAPGEIASLGAIARPVVSVITSVGRAHLEQFGSIERIAVEKASLLGTMEPEGLAVVFSDSDILEKALRYYHRRIIRFGQSDLADLRLTAWETDGSSQRFELNGHISCRLPVPGRHNALNALAAIGVARRFGIDEAAAVDAMEGFTGIEMRLQRIVVGGVTIINDAYNANPASMFAAVDTLAEIPAKRRVVIAGDMRELGDQSEQLHLQTGREIARRNIDLVIGIGLLGRYISDGASQEGTTVEAFDLIEQAHKRIASLLSDGDVVLLKGSRAMAMERLVDPIRSAFEEK